MTQSDYSADLSQLLDIALKALHLGIVRSIDYGAEITGMSTITIERHRFTFASNGELVPSAPYIHSPQMERERYNLHIATLTAAVEQRV